VTARRTVRVTAELPTRLDAYVRAMLPGTSRRLVRALVEDGSVLVNGRPARKGAHLVAGDVVGLPLLEPLAPEPDLPLAILYEDADLVAVDKPGGVPGHALDPRQRGTIAGALVARYPELASIGDASTSGLVHRLDTGTSGVLVAARSAGAYDALRAAFRRHEVTKRYLAVVAGIPRAGTIVDAPLAHDPRDRRRMRVARSGERAWPARTWLGAVERRGEFACVEIEISTGAMHQVRVHLAHLGCPVVGDTLYGGPAAALHPDRHALHAREIHVAGRRLRIEAPVPDDLRRLVR
jgi:23S rRNA pseudouridine1911/1915/1917 synthase